MFLQVLALSALLAVSSSAPVSEVHYSPADAVSSQSIIRHDQPAVATNFVHPPVGKLAVATPVFHSAPTAVTYANTSPITYHAAPIHYSPANVVSSQSILHHGHPLPTLATKLVATPVTKIAVTAPVHYSTAPVQYSTAPVQYSTAPVQYSTAPLQYATAPLQYTPISKVITPVTKVIAPVTKVIQPNKVLVAEKHVEEYIRPKYEFSYSVDDDQSGDHKSQHEIRDGDVVQGHYTMLEADGTIRRVEYTADDEQGFNAVVSHSAPTHPQPQAHLQPHP